VENKKGFLKDFYLYFKLFLKQNNGAVVLKE